MSSTTEQLLGRVVISSDDQNVSQDGRERNIVLDVGAWCLSPSRSESVGRPRISVTTSSSLRMRNHTSAAFCMLVISIISGYARENKNDLNFAHISPPAKSLSSTSQQHWTQSSGAQVAMWQRPQNYQQQQQPTRKAQPTVGSALHASGSRTIAIKQQQQQQILRSTDALAPVGGLPQSVTRTMNPRILFMAAIADFAYVKELGSSTRRQDCAPCLRQWGARGDPVVLDSVDAAGGISHCTIFRTDYDLFLVFRGLDELSNIYYVEMDTARENAAAYFGVTNTAAAAAAAAQAGAAMGKHGTHYQPGPDSKGGSSSSNSNSNGRSSDTTGDKQFYVLRGFLRAHMAIEPLYVEKLNELAGQLPVRQRSRYKIWIIGHSDGSSLAQLSALRLSYTLGPDKLGGVLLFGAQRVGSPAFASYYNSVLGNQTLRVQYGWDPATEFQYLATDGLQLVGKGFAVCPNPGHSTERVVEVPVGIDVRFACGEPAPAASTSMGIAAALMQPFLQDFVNAPVQRTAAGVLKSVSSEHLNKQSAVGYRGRDKSLQRKSSSTTCRNCTAGIPGTGRLYWDIAAADGTAALLHITSAERRSSSSARRGWRSSSSSSSSSSSKGVLDIQYLAHHMPAVIYDGLLRVLGSAVDNSTLAALQLPLCAVSSKCAAALRQNPGSRCATCAAAETCSQYWQGVAGSNCDNLHPLWSGNLCYGSFFPPGIIGLLGLFD